jgi:replicative DNA helicase
MLHLKQPSGEVGPLKIEHDHLAGRSIVYRGFDVLAFLRLHPAGATVMEVARAMFERPAPTDAERIKAQRRLDGLVKHGLAVKDNAKVGGDGGSIGARYRSSESFEDELRDLVG